MTTEQSYPIGTPGKPWTGTEKQQWRQNQTRVRRYKNDVLDVLQQLDDRYEIVQYGELRYSDDIYPLVAAKSKDWDDKLPVALITGGVHGYETSGVLGALDFLSECQNEYAGKVNILVVPCVSPWAYERIVRWNYDAVDPNRQFFPEGKAEESLNLMALISQMKGRFLVHIDLHETTDTDESEFSPALAARDGVQYVPVSIPDGFYLVGNKQNSRLDFLSAIISAVAEVTHIAPTDDEGKLLGFPVVSAGVIEFDDNAYHICATITGTPFAATTEVYPDSAKTSPEECIRAQIVTIRRAIEFALSN